MQLQTLLFSAGSAPDWTDILQGISAPLSLIVSIVGLRYVYKTLKEQTALNRAQFELFKIESSRAAREIRPVVRLDIVVHNNRLEGKIRLEKNIMKEAKYRLKVTGDVWCEQVNEELKLLRFLSQGPDDLLEFQVIFKPEMEAIPRVDLLLNFMDEDERKYEQQFHYDTAEGRVRAHPPTDAYD